MPAYRRPELIGASIESVLAQSYSNWQLLVSENGPGGGEVEEAVRPYTGDPRIRYVATGANLGPAANWTRLLQAGTAKYFTVLQDDDVWDPGFLAARVSFLEQYPSCGYVFSGERMMDHDGREIAVERTRALAAKDVSEVLAEGVYAPEELLPAMYRHRLGGIHAPEHQQRRGDVSSLGARGGRTVLRRLGPVPVLGRRPLHADVAEISNRVSRRSRRRPADPRHRRQPARERDQRFDLRRRALGPLPRVPPRLDPAAASRGEAAARSSPASAPRRSSSRHSTRSSAATGAAARTTCANAVAVDPLAVLNPRVTAGAIGLLFGERGRRILHGARNAARRRGRDARLRTRRRRTADATPARIRPCPR